jgi:tripeptidyl-peptidase-1
MGLLLTLPLVFLAKCVLSSTMVLHESISHIPAGFKASGPPPPTQEIKLFIALVQSNITGLAKIVDAVSVPSSSAYGQYLTAAEVSSIRPIYFVSLYRILFD